MKEILSTLTGINTRLAIIEDRMEKSSASFEQKERMSCAVRFEIPESFYLEEVRCDYTISAQMKKVWAEEIKLYGLFCDVCHKHGIRHFWAYGNLLGAARHQGFIPWDDDLDIALLKKDYIRLEKILCEMNGKNADMLMDIKTKILKSGESVTVCDSNNETAILLLSGDVTYNFDGKAEAAIKALKDGADFIYVHLEAPDEAGHRREIENKVKAIEAIDARALRPMIEYLDGCGIPVRK